MSRLRKAVIVCPRRGAAVVLRASHVQRIWRFQSRAGTQHGRLQKYCFAHG